MLVVIYLRSEGNGTGALAPVPQASTSSGSSSGGEQGSGSNVAAVAGRQAPGPGPANLRVFAAHIQRAAGRVLRRAHRATATYTGPVVENPYGPVQVAVAEQGGKIVDVKALQMPTEHALSQEISEHVAPMLRTEALQAQSAEINVISGATYTSEGFASSLQAALRQAG